MKKTLSILLCLIIVFSFAACGDKNQEEKAMIGEVKEYNVGDYKFNLPETYVFNDLTEVKAEPNCIAMLTDSEKTLPDLWVYEDECQGSTIKEHIMKLDATWNFSEMSFSSKDDVTLARTVYDEDWYGQELVNEHYYRIENGTKVLSFDFAYSKTDDAKIAHENIIAMADVIGF